MGGDDNTDSSEKYNVGGNDNAESSEEYNSDSSSESPTPQLNKKTHGKLNSDKVPKAMMYTTTHDDDETVEIAKHREIFMDRAFSEVDNNVDGLEDTRESSLRSQQELDDISYILTHWGIGINLKQVTDMNLRKKLSSFRKKNKVGAHHVDKYHTEEITLPSGERRKILRRIKKGSVGRIVLSQERIFDASKSGMTTAVVTLGKSEPGCYVVKNTGIALRLLFVCSVRFVQGVCRRILQSSHAREAEFRFIHVSSVSGSKLISSICESSESVIPMAS